MRLKLLPIVLITLLFDPVWSQSEKRRVASTDYDKWSTLSGEQISPDGKWVSYSVCYKSGADTLYLQNVKSGKRRAFIDAVQMSFSSNGKWFAVQEKEAGVQVYDMQLRKSAAFLNVSRYEFTPDGKHLVILSRATTQLLTILSTQAKTEVSARDVSEFRINKHGNIAWIDKSGISIYKSGGQPSNQVIRTDSGYIVSGLSWNDDGTKLAFFETQKTSGQNPFNATIGVFDIISGRVVRLQSQLLPKGYNIVAAPSRPVLFSNNGRQIFFFIRAPKTTKAKNELVEVWDASTPFEHPVQEKFDAHENEYYLTQWDLGQDKVERIGTEDFPFAMLLPNKGKAIKYAPQTYEPQFEEFAPVDYYMQDLDTQKNDKFIERHSRESYALQTSPSGKYLAYFKNGHWCLYDTQSGAQRNITQDLNQNFRNLEIDVPGEDFSYGSPGFTNDGKYLIVYDQYDVWLIETENGKSKKLTDGRKRKTRYRLESDLYLIKPQTAAEFIKYDIDLKKGLVFRAVDAEMSSGYFLWTHDKPLKTLVWGKSLTSNIRKAKLSNRYLYLEQTASLPPSLKIAEAATKPIVVFQSNPHYKQFGSTSSELLTIQHDDGHNALATLLYPSNYVAGRKYPMIVYIYEVLSQNLHQYNMPSTDSPYGFSPANYTFDGYFVLMPDIHYTIGNPGGSALRYVESAVKTVLSTGMIDSTRVGIIGHSFGGYQTTYIITKSKLFAAAVIGSGVTDLIRKYFTMNFGTGRSNNWRIERQQFRMGLSPLVDNKSYKENSPINFIGDITTPILNWAGKDDPVVSWEQGLALHLALRRAGKPNTFLLYPNEGHVLSNHAAQLDINERIKNWFDSYLKPDTN